MDFITRYHNLNTAQKKAVDTIEGPLMVVAGPGTGKTELLSLRIANILQKTDTAPESILCLTFTDSGVAAIRERLLGIIGRDAHKVAVHTFHSFAAEVINQNREFFFRGAKFKLSDDLSRYQILSKLFSELAHDNPLASVMNGEFTHLKEVSSSITELKSSGLTTRELSSILDQNDKDIELAESVLAPIFSLGMKKTTPKQVEAVFGSLKIKNSSALVSDIPRLIEALRESLQLPLTESLQAGSTKALTTWKNDWFEKDDQKNTVLKSRKRQIKLRAMLDLYNGYLKALEEAGLYDYDDMVLDVIAAMQNHPDLKFNLQEKFLYLMVDEFQDTNLAQMRIILNLLNSEVSNGQPNIMTVGDDDQAIYGFQGATVSNIHHFIRSFPDALRVVLTDNYRSSQPILDYAQSVIRLGSDRLERSLPGINKTLESKTTTPINSEVILNQYPSLRDERQSVADQIKARLEAGEAASSIAVIARRHAELIELLPYLAKAGIVVSYEKRSNVLELDSIKQIELTARIALNLFNNSNQALALLPELLTHHGFKISAEAVWQLSTKAYQNRSNWLDTMSEFTELAPIKDWLLELAKLSPHTSLEQMIDLIIGHPEASFQANGFRSPYYEYFFSEDHLSKRPEEYLVHLSGLIALRTKLLDHIEGPAPTLSSLIAFIDLQRQSKQEIIDTAPPNHQQADAINLMTAHKAKGLEFDTVFILNGVESNWGEKARKRNRSISYPENLPLTPPGDSFDDRLRLFYVAMTRAKTNLIISYSVVNDSGKELFRAGFLVSEAWDKINKVHLIEEPLTSDMTTKLEIEWYRPLVSEISPSMKQLLLPRLQNYKLSATDLNNFLDLTRGGPSRFIIDTLLKFPAAPSPAPSYGQAIHETLQKAHSVMSANHTPRPAADILKDFKGALTDKRLTSEDFEFYLKKGTDALTAFLNSPSTNFSTQQRAELSFSNQGVVVGEARLTGILDVIDIDKSDATIIDYKTGKPTDSWKGKQDYQKVRLHNYRNQLMFYNILMNESRDYAKYSISSSQIQFIEPSSYGKILRLEARFTAEELDRFRQLVQSVWRRIMSLDMPDTSDYQLNYQAIVEFENYLIDS